MAVNRIQVSCDGYSGDAASIVTLVELRVDGELVVSLPSPRSFSGAWKLEGDHVVQVWDRTAGNDYDREWGETTHGGPDSVLHATFTVSCPVTTTTEPATTVAETTTPAAPTTTVAPEPTVTVGVETTQPVPTMPEGLYVIDLGTTTVVTTVPDPVGCCSEYVGEVTASTVQPHGTLPATGGVTDGVVPMGFGVFGVGVMLWAIARRPRRA